MESNLGLLLTYTLSLLMMVVLPVVLAFFVVQRFKVSWWVILTGVVTYVVSQTVFYLVLSKLFSAFNKGTLSLPPDQWLPLFVSVIIGLFTALFEESARYLGLLVISKKVRRIGSGIGLGVAHGGMEGIALALWPFFPIFGGVLFRFFEKVFFNPGVQLAKGVLQAEVQNVLNANAQFWSLPWHVGLLYGVQIILNISLQILLSVLVWKAVRYRKFLWLGLAFFYHMLVSGIAAFLNYSGWSNWAIDGVLAVFMLANIYLVYYFWKEESENIKEKAALSSSEGADAENDLDEEGEGDEDDEDEFDEEDDEEFDDEEEADEQAAVS